MGAHAPFSAFIFLLSLLLLSCLVGSADGRTKKPKPYLPPVGYTKIKNIVVIFLEGWSFDSVLPQYPGVPTPANTTQTSKAGFKYVILPPPLLAPGGANNSRTPDPRFPSDAPVKPFDLTVYYPSTTQSPPLEQRYWQEQYQINSGKMDKFVAWSDAGGLPLGYVNSTTNPLTSMTRREGAVLAGVHHSVYGGGFLNLMYLTCAQVPRWTDAPSSVTQVFSTTTSQELLVDNSVTPNGYVVNDILPTSPPLPLAVPPIGDRLPPLTMRTVGENLTDANVTWAWYSGGWNDAEAGLPDATFQFEQQPYAFFANFSPSSPMRSHLQDEQDFFDVLRNGSLPEVSFIKPLGKQSGLAGMGTLLDAENYAVKVVNALQESPFWPGCLVIVMYTDNGGRYDSRTPPKRDQFGPGARVPVYMLGPLVKSPLVDLTIYETASLLKLLHDRYGITMPKNITNLDGFSKALNLDPHKRPGFPWWGIVFILVFPFILLAACLGVVWYLQHIAHVPTGWTGQTDQEPVAP